MENAKLIRLDNGMSAALDRVESVETALVGVWVDTGALNETAGDNGISHFAEHMLFKGTARRTYLDIAEEIEDAGGEINAYTAKDHTFFWARMLKENIATGIDILADMALCPALDETETAKEREVIVQEYFGYLDDPDELAHDMFDAAAYPGQPMGLPVIGTIENIRSMTPAKLRAYMRNNYTAGRTRAIVAGNFDEESVLRLIEKHFARIGAGGEASTTPSQYTGGNVFRESDLEHVHLVLGFEASRIGARRESFAEALLSNALGGSMSSRLFQEAREKLNLAYSIHSSAHGFADTGTLSIHTSTEPANINKTIECIVGEIRKIRVDGITPKELARAKTCHKADIAAGLESIARRAGAIGYSVQNFGRIIPARESIETAESITMDDVREAAARIFSSAPTIAANGPTGGIQDIGQIRQKLLK
jgi:predicted Zn-dependent peptidase